MKKKIIFLSGLLLTVALLGACGNEPVALSKLKTAKYVTLGEYKGLEVSEPDPEVTEEYLNNYIQYVLTSHAELKETSGRAAKNGDTLNIDYEGKMDGKTFEGGTAQGQDLELGSNSFIEGFESGLIGANVGDTKELKLKFPVPYSPNPDFAGKEVVFTVKVNKIQEKITPELTDEFVKTVSDECKTVDEYKKFVHDLLMQDATANYEKNVETALVEKAAAGCTFKEPPEYMVDDNYDKIVKNLTSYAAMYGADFNTLVSQYYGGMDAFEKEARDGAKKSAEQSIMLQAIANAEGIEITQQVIDEYMQQEVDNGTYGSVDDMKTAIGEGNYEDFVMSEKVIALLKENATVKNEPAESDAASETAETAETEAK